MAKKHKLPAVLSFQRRCMITDGLFYNAYKDKTEIDPVFVFRHGIRGTQNIRWSDEKIKKNREETANIQTTDTAKLAPNADALCVLFQLRTLDVSHALFSIAPGTTDTTEDILAFKADLEAFVRRAKAGDALDQLACRYVRNIANGRFLWRNRSIAEAVTVKVTSNSGVSAEFNALKMPLNSFDDVSADERAVAEVLAQGWKGVENHALHISSFIDYGISGKVEVFPSQNYVENMPRGLARILYTTGIVTEDCNERSTFGHWNMGQAALRDQKIGNALRTIDTWYPAYAERRIPIPVEPNGANLGAMEFFRKKGESSGFKLMERVGELDPETPEGLFLLACLIRGGVFSGKD